MGSLLSPPFPLFSMTFSFPSGKCEGLGMYSIFSRFLFLSFPPPAFSPPPPTTLFEKGGRDGRRFPSFLPPPFFLAYGLPNEQQRMKDEPLHHVPSPLLSPRLPLLFFEERKRASHRKRQDCGPFPLLDVSIHSQSSRNIWREKVVIPGER